MEDRIKKLNSIKSETNEKSKLQYAQFYSRDSISEYTLNIIISFYWYVTIIRPNHWILF